MNDLGRMLTRHGPSQRVIEWRPSFGRLTYKRIRGLWNWRWRSLEWLQVESQEAPETAFAAGCPVALRAL